MTIQKTEKNNKNKQCNKMWDKETKDKTVGFQKMKSDARSKGFQLDLQNVLFSELSMEKKTKNLL